VNVVLLVVLIVVGVGLVQAAIWIPLVRSWRKKAAVFQRDLDADMAASGERIVRGPERAVYRGGTPPFGAVRGNGTIVLTDRRLIFRKISGGIVDVPTSTISGTREAVSFLSSRVGNRVHFIVTTNNPAEVAFFVDDLDAWNAAVEASTVT
jgi:hypothetical protein